MKSSDTDRLLKLDDKNNVIIEYKSGATYCGELKEKKRCGQGVFRWSNGSSYKGDFAGNQRHGDGVQQWCEGSLYVGQFQNDCRHGYGRHTWNSGEYYEGFFSCDKRNGKGVYHWSDGTKYEGFFNNDVKQGFGIFTFADGRKYEGLYKDGIRYGAGILTYPNGCQDVGIWQEDKLVKLCSVMETAFIFQHFPHYYVNAGEQLPLKIREANNALSEAKSAVISEEKPASGEEYIIGEIPQSFPYMDILHGIRSRNHGAPGPCELTSEQFLNAAAQGDYTTLVRLLEKRLVHVDVTDKTGYGALLAASVNCHRDVVNSILDYGGHVNMVNNEGLSALAACHVLFYTQHTWKHNIAETMGEENLFNSVRWDIPNGTFVQRKYKMKNNKNIEYETNNDRYSNETINAHKKTTKVATCDEETHNCVECAKFTKNTINKNDNNPPDNNNHNDQLCDKRTVTNDVKRFLDEQLNKVDKNIYINEFLSRTASAMSNQCSFLSHENMEVCIEKLSPDKRNYFNADIRNCKNFIELNEVKDRMKETNLLQNDASTTVSCSNQNTFSCSIQGKHAMEDNPNHEKQKLLTQQRRPHLEATVRLLLKRGADPNCSSLPMPVLFFAVKAADTAAVEVLLNKGASPHARLSVQELGITPLHIAVALPEDAVVITELLLASGADPNMRDLAFGRKELGRTSLHIACCREDNDQVANRLILLLLHHKANPDLLCRGHSALSLAIASGNDMAVDSLLKHHADPSLPLTHGVGSALCAAVSFSAERRRRLVDRLRLVNKLVRNGANILAPIVISNGQAPGTVVDYAYCVFNQDRRIAYTPYHSLTCPEREVFVSRRTMLEHLAEVLRTYALKKEKQLLEEQLSQEKSAVAKDAMPEKTKENDRSVSFCDNSSENLKKISFIESSSLNVSPAVKVTSSLSSETRLPDCGLRVTIVNTPSDHMTISRQALNSSKQQVVRKNRFRYCYECGRSVGVRLSHCTRCKEVYYCGRNCKLKAWNTRHKEECVKLAGYKAMDTCRSDNQALITNTN